MTTEGHLEILRRMILRVLLVVTMFAICLFVFKGPVFRILLAPRDSDFIFYRAVESLLLFFGIDFHFKPFAIEMISTDLSAQFVAHISTSFYLAILLSSPYILFEVFAFVAPALYDNERKYALPILGCSYLLFGTGVLMTYFILFPFSFRFLGTYQVEETVRNTITLSSYINTFSSMTFIMGLVFQLPILTYILGKIGIVSYELLSQYRKWAVMIVLTLSAIITPPDIFTLFMVALPLYILFEISLRILKHIRSS